MDFPFGALYYTINGGAVPKRSAMRNTSCSGAAGTHHFRESDNITFCAAKRITAETRSVYANASSIAAFSASIPSPVSAEVSITARAGASSESV